MTEDNLILLFAFIICWLTIVWLTLISINKKRTLIINLFTQVAYSLFFFYGLNFKSEYGGGLVWWFFFLIVIGAHFFVNATIATIILIRPIFKAKTSA